MTTRTPTNYLANRNAYIIDMNGALTVTKLTSPQYARAFGNAVVLPNGKVILIGGMTKIRVFTEDTAVLPTELWDPGTKTFTLLPSVAIPRTYHSAAILLPDGRVLSGGGGLCSPRCPEINRPDVQILTPYYLLNADGSPAERPSITSAPSNATHGTQIEVRTSSAVTSFALLRMSSVTHSVNNDQRRIPLAPVTVDANTYRLELPSNPHVVLPGYYMLFALNDRGVPSVSSAIRITGDAAPKLDGPGPQSNDRGSGVYLPLSATAPSGSPTFRASSLPPGLSIDAATGVISGIVSNSARTTSPYWAEVTAQVGTGPKTSIRILWTITPLMPCGRANAAPIAPSPRRAG